MTDRELRKLRRSDLLELLIQQDEEMDALKKRLEKAEEELRSRKITINTAGSIAAASVSISGVFEAAQDAAARYLENIEELSAKQEEICAQMEEKSRKEAEKLLRVTEEKCRRMEEETYQYCERMWSQTARETKGSLEKPLARNRQTVSSYAYSS